MFYEGLKIFGEVSTPCMQNSPEDFYIAIEKSLRPLSTYSVQKEFPSSELLATLLQTLPSYEVTHYLQRYFESPERRSVLLKAYQLGGEDTQGVALLVPGNRIKVPILDLRVIKVSEDIALGGFRGINQSSVGDDFEPAAANDYVLGWNILHILKENRRLITDEL